MTLDELIDALKLMRDDGLPGDTIIEARVDMSDQYGSQHTRREVVSVDANDRVTVHC